MNYYLRIGQGMEIRIGIKQLHGRKRFINVNISKILILFESCNSMYKRILILYLLTHRSYYVYETSFTHCLYVSVNEIFPKMPNPTYYWHVQIPYWSIY